MLSGVEWPRSAEELKASQDELRATMPPCWEPTPGWLAGGCAVSFAPDERAWAAAVLLDGRSLVASAVAEGMAGGRYEPGLLALREGPLLEAAVRALPRAPDVLFINASGRDHPRRAGLAIHLGAVLGLPTVGVTQRPLVARGAAPGYRRGEIAPVKLAGEVVGYWVRTRTAVRPVVAHAAWRVDAERAARLVLEAARKRRTPEPLRRARALAKDARGRAPHG